MALPAGLQTVTVHGEYLHPDGTPFRGRVVFAPEPATITNPLHDVIVLGDVIARLTADGQFTVTLLATDAAGCTPTGWTYRVREQWLDAPRRDYPISLPAAAPTVDLADIAPTDPAAGEYTVITGPAGPTGPKGDKGDQGDTGPAGPQPPLGSAGAGPTIALRSDDPTTTNARTPLAHAASHATGGSDPITPTAIGALPLAGGTINGGLVIDRFAAPVGYPIGQAGSVASLNVPSSYAGGDDDGTGTDSTGRINLYSAQRANVGSFGEVIRCFPMRADAKTMQAFYIPVQSANKKGGYDPATRDPMATGISWKPVVWAGSHYEANDHGSIHGHWELEIADLNGALQGRLEVPFIDQAVDGAKALDQVGIGVAYTNIRTNLADLSVRAQNMTAGPYSGQNTCFRVGGNNSVNKDVALSISSDMGTTGRRWILRANTTTEAGANVGTDFQIRRYDDSGTFLDASVHIERSTGRVGMGGVTTPTAGLHLQRASGQVLYLDAQATTQSAILVNGVDATVKALQAQIAGDTQKRYQVLTDGTMSWGTGAATPDVTLYRANVGRLKTDTAFHIGTNLLVNTTSTGGGVGVIGMANATTPPASAPSGGGALYVEAGALKYKGSSGTITTIALA